MKKTTIIFTVFTLIAIFLLTGCNNTNSQSVATTISLSSEDEYLLTLAQKAESFSDVYSILEVNDSEEFQIALANSSNHIVQEALLNYENLKTSTLIVICKDPKSPNISHATIRNYFTKAIHNADLTAEQELQIAKIQKQPMQMGILYRENISADALIYLIESNNTFNWVINLNHYEIKEILYKQILNVPLSLDQKKKLEDLDIYVVDQALKEKEKQEFQKALIP